MLFHKPRPERSLALALIDCRLLKPGAKLRVDRELGPAGPDWVTALRHRTIRMLAWQKHIQHGLFDTCDMASATSPDFSGKRLLVCYNPLLAAERRRLGTLRRREMGKHFFHWRARRARSGSCACWRTTWNAACAAAWRR